MKVTHICLTGGYTENLNYQENYLTRYQALDGNEVSIITTQYCWHKNVWGKCGDTDYRNEYGVHVIRIPYKFKIPYKLNTWTGRFCALEERLRELAPDVIFIHNLQFQDIQKIKKYKKEHPEIRIYADNHSDFSNSARGWIAKNILYKGYWKRYAKSIESSVDRFYGVMPARVDFLKDVYGLDEKKVGLLMKAVRNLPDSRVKLWVFGSVEEELKAEFFALCDGYRVRYLGWAKGEQSYEYFSAADLVVFPGRHSVYWEQAAGMGIPMVCKYWEGTTHIDIGGNVRFLKKDSVEEIQEVIEELRRNPEKYREMKRAAESGKKAVFSYREISRRAIAAP